MADCYSVHLRSSRSLPANGADIPARRISDREQRLPRLGATD
jgi:hypothetical protein